MTGDLWALSSACATGKKLAKVKALGLVPTSACALVHWLVSASVVQSALSSASTREVPKGPETDGTMVLPLVPSSEGKLGERSERCSASHLGRVKGSNLAAPWARGSAALLVASSVAKTAAEMALELGLPLALGSWSGSL